MLSISNVLGGTSAESPHFMYALNSANQRSAITNTDGSYWLFTYDRGAQAPRLPCRDRPAHPR